MIVDLAVAREDNAKRVIHDGLPAVPQTANGQTNRADDCRPTHRDSGAVRTAMRQRGNHRLDTLAPIPGNVRVPKRHDAADTAHVSLYGPG